MLRMREGWEKEARKDAGVSRAAMARCKEGQRLAQVPVQVSPLALAIPPRGRRFT
jgi:hypothetical protein